MALAAAAIEKNLVKQFISNAQNFAPGTKLRWLIRPQNRDSTLIAGVRLPAGLSASSDEVFALHDLSGSLSESFNLSFSITVAGIIPEGSKLSLDFIDSELVSVEPDVAPWFTRFEMALRERHTDPHAAERDLINALEIAIKKLGASDPAVYQCLQVLAQVYLQNLGNPRKAVATLQAANMLIPENDLWPDPTKIELLDSLADALFELGHYDESKTILKNLLSKKIRVYGDSGWSTIQHLMKLADRTEVENERFEFSRAALDAIFRRLKALNLDPMDPSTWSFEQLTEDLAMSVTGEVDVLVDLLHFSKEHDLENQWRARLRDFWESKESDKKNLLRLGIIEAQKQKGAPKFFLEFHPLSHVSFENRVAIYESYSSFTEALETVGVHGIPESDLSWPEGTVRYFLISNIPSSSIESILQRPEYGSY